MNLQLAPDIFSLLPRLQPQLSKQHHQYCMLFFKSQFESFFMCQWFEIVLEYSFKFVTSFIFVRSVIQLVEIEVCMPCGVGDGVMLQHVSLKIEVCCKLCIVSQVVKICQFLLFFLHFVDYIEYCTIMDKSWMKKKRMSTV